jgi:hypothetical protein
MSRRAWGGLPEGVREAIERRCGGIDEVVDAPTGTTCEFAGTVVVGPAAKLFCKATRVDGRQAWMLRNELRVNSLLPVGAAPRVLWELTAGEWLVVAFEHVEGRHADFSQGSSDLGAIAAALDLIGACGMTGSAVRLQPIEDRWSSVAVDDAGTFAGPTLLHTDPAASNLLVKPDGSVGIVDWGWPARGAPWIDAALVVVHLIRHGHHPAEAERWAATTHGWPAARPDRLDALAATLYRLRARQAEADSAPHRSLAAAAARTWLDHRRRHAG